MVQTAPDLTVRPVETAADLDAFLDLPAKVYAHDPNWVPPIRSSIAKQLAPDYIFRTYGTLQALIAIQNGDVVGRIVAAVNQRLVEREGEAIGLFGYFECMPEEAIAQALFRAAEDWLRQQGMTRVRGPINLSTHNDCLFLVDGFDTPPQVMMPYNPAYYPEFIERDGWEKAKDAYAYEFFPEQLAAGFEKGYRVALKSGVTFRPIRTKGEGFKEDCVGLYHLFNKAFTNNWSSTPRTLEEFLDDAKELQSLVDPDVFPIAEYDGEMVGFFMGFPDYNIPLKHVNGRLNWLGILKFLWYRRQIDQGRVIAICSLPEYRRKMVPLGLGYLGMAGGFKKGKPYKKAELSWVYEDNMPSRKLIEATGGKIYKTYRIYEKHLG
ncbi:MAG: hypothetical protein IGR80_17040 [Synechococcales cyanobacterium K44_A2020_017]|jgi:GNAT superfamily N-acetyltransferase|nr:hypothetical protein [Synechococcales cyanobacterium K32_A2020_035]MBF2096444.1 hypothetical protein [Synechococcales cyanobacterium K44_A2020_017]